MTSPLRPVAAALLVGAVAGLLGAGAGLAWAILGAGSIVTLLAARRTPRIAWTVLAATVAGLAGVLRAADVADGPPPAEPVALTRIEGQVTRAADFDEAPRGDDDDSADEASPGRERAAAFRIEAQCARYEVRLRFRDGEPVPAFLPGDRVALIGSVEPIRAPSNPGEPDRRLALGRESVCGVVTVDAAGAVADLGTGPMSLATRVRRAGEVVRRRLLVRLTDACGGDGPVAALLACLLLGDRTRMDDATVIAFRDSGTAHLLSVSGLHVVLLVMAVRGLARRVTPRRVRRRLALPALVVLLVVYCALCRFATPVVRSAVFLGVAEIARATGRRPSPLDTLAAAAAIVVAADPGQVLDPSFQLSFAAVAGLALFTRGFRAALFPSLALYRKFPGAISARRLRLYERVATGLSSSMAATSATAPIVAQVFGRLQLVAALSNLVAVPIAAVAVPLAAVLAIVGGAAPWLTAPVATAVAVSLRCVVGVAARIPGATVALGPTSPVLIAVATAALVAAAGLIRRRPRAGLAAAAVAWLALAATPFVASPNGPPEVVALDVGHGLCVLVRTGDGGAVLFDAGGHAPAIGRRSIVPALRACGVRRLGAVFVSHQDSDHCGAVFDVLDEFSVGEVIVSAGFGADPEPRALVAKCRAMHLPVEVTQRGDVWSRRLVEVRTLGPRADGRPASDNEASIVAWIVAGSGDAALTAIVPGDIEGPPFIALAADPTNPAARVLLLPHHGRGDPAEHLALARRVSADVLIASTSAASPMAVPGALVTGIVGAVRVRPGEPPRSWPWPEH